MTTPADAPFVSCVMIFLDAERYLAEAITSVRAQTSDDWELVLVDDGSTDGSSAIARNAAASDPARIRYVEHPGHANRGMSASRNAGVTAGRGAYIAFLDSDDIWLPDWVETFTAAADRFPQAGLIYGPTLYWYDWRPEAERPADWPGNFTDKLGMPAEKLIHAPEALRRVLTSDGPQPPCICSLLIRADAYRGVGGFEEAFRGLYEDQVFLSKMFYHHDVVLIEHVRSWYRQHDESCCYQGIKTREYHPEDYHPARARFLRWLRDYLVRQPSADPVILAAIARRCRPYEVPLYAALANFQLRCRRKASFLSARLRAHPRLSGARRLKARASGLFRRRAAPAEVTGHPPRS